jgi:hypothetical protein
MIRRDDRERRSDTLHCSICWSQDQGIHHPIINRNAVAKENCHIMRERRRQRWIAKSRMVGCVLLVSLLQLLINATAARAQEDSRILAHPEVRSLPSKEKRWALIVGIDEYEKDVSSLKGAVNDARALKDILVKQAGFPESQVILLTSDAADRDQLPTRGNILEELDNLTGRVPADGLFLFSFSGHGVSIANEAYLIPSDGRITKSLKLLRNFSIDVRWIKDAIEDSKIKQVLMLLDACRNEVGRGDAANPLTEAYKSGFSFDVVNSGVKAFATLYATSIGYRAFEFLDRDTRRYRGYFSYAVEEGLKGKAANARGEITLGGLTDYVDRIVPEKVRSAKGERQEPFKEIAGYKESELVLAMAAANNTSTNIRPSSVSERIDPVAVEREYWETIRSSEDTQDYKGYLESYPKGAYAGVAHAKIRQLDAAKKVAPPDSDPSYNQPSSTRSKASLPVEAPNTSFTIKVTVGAEDVSNGWTNSGLVIRRGQQIHIRASGRVSLGSGRFSTPTGLLNVTDLQKLMLREPTGGLIAVIGDDNDDFIFIGAEREITAQQDGVLFLGVNDGDLTDNAGSYEVTIDSRLLEVTNSTSKPANTEVVPEASPAFFTLKVSVRADDANNGWTNSGLVVRRGQQIRINASGRVSIGGGRFSEPAGLPSIADSDKLMKSEPTGGLIAVVGDDNDDFIFIGAAGEFTSQRDGVLFLGVNESRLTDNTGSYDVVIAAQASNKTSSTSPPINTGAAAEASRAFFTIKVRVRADDANNGWTNSGLVVQRGQQIRISASGQVSIGEGRFSEPDGLPSISDSAKLVKGKPTGGLIAVVGDDNDDFIFIGAEGEFTAQRDGVLFLGVNEGNLTDNTGSYEVVIAAQANKTSSNFQSVNRVPGSEASPGFFTIKVRVRADNMNNGWTNSGLVVRSGQQIRISASGRVSIGEGRFSEPVGLPRVADSDKLMRNWPTGGLIAVIGDDNDDFMFIGAEREFIAQRDGVLFLGVNDGNLTDNAGSYDVVIAAEAKN